MGYQRVMGYGSKSPAYQLGGLKNLWVLREYGLSGLWVKRASTVFDECASNSLYRTSEPNPFHHYVRRVSSKRVM